MPSQTSRRHLEIPGGRRRPQYSQETPGRPTPRPLGDQKKAKKREPNVLTPSDGKCESVKTIKRLNKTIRRLVRASRIAFAQMGYLPRDPPRLPQGPGGTFLTDSLASSVGVAWCPSGSTIRAWIRPDVVFPHRLHYQVRKQPRKHRGSRQKHLGSPATPWDI